MKYLVEPISFEAKSECVVKVGGACIKLTNNCGCQGSKGSDPCSADYCWTKHCPSYTRPLNPDEMY